MEMKLGAAIKKLRSKRKITQEELADYLGVSFQAVSKWETDTTMPDITLLPRLALFFGVKIDDLFSVNLDDELERIDSILANERLTDDNFRYAKRILDSLLHDDREDTAALKRYAELLLKRSNQDTLEAGRLLERAMTLSPLDGEISTMYRRARGGGREAFQSGTDWFIRVCEPILWAHPANGKLWELLIEAMLDMRCFDRVEKLISKAKTEENGPEQFAEIWTGDLAFAKGDIESAFKIWDAISSEDPKLLYELGERFNRANLYKKAIACFEKSFRVETSPRDLSAVYSLAFLYTKLERRKDAISAWQCILNVLAADYRITKGETVDWAKREIEKLNSVK